MTTEDGGGLHVSLEKHFSKVLELTTENVAKAIQPLEVRVKILEAWQSRVIGGTAVLMLASSLITGLLVYVFTKK